jgi:hypothetical protein
MCATLASAVDEFTRPMYSSINFGLLPADVIRVGFEMNVGWDMRAEPFSLILKPTPGIGRLVCSHRK